MKMLSQVLRSLFKRPFTRKYPKVKVTPPEGFRGKLVYHREICIGCQQCVRVCPADAIKFFKTTKKIEIDMMKCVFCGWCVDVCPEGAIESTKEIVLAQDNDELKTP